MFGLGTTELLVILFLALLVLGPERIPKVASQIGKAIRGFRRATQDLKDQIDEEGEIGQSLADLHSALRGDPPALLAKETEITTPAPLILPPAHLPVLFHEEPEENLSKPSEESLLKIEGDIHQETKENRGMG